MSKWLGPKENYRLYHEAHDPLVKMMLVGVAGVSPNHGGHRMSKRQAKSELDAARASLKKMLAQDPAPTMKARAWTKTLVGKMKVLIHAAERVYTGERLPKMSQAYYAQLNTRLGVRR